MSFHEKKNTKLQHECLNITLYISRSSVLEHSLIDFLRSFSWYMMTRNDRTHEEQNKFHDNHVTSNFFIPPPTFNAVHAPPCMPRPCPSPEKSARPDPLLTNQTPPAPVPAPAPFPYPPFAPSVQRLPPHVTPSLPFSIHGVVPHHESPSSSSSFSRMFPRAPSLRMGILIPCKAKHLLRSVLSITPGNFLAL